mgnify:CR=1 FL=1
MIVAAESCDIEGGIVCTPSNVNELFVFKPIFYIGETGISRTHFLILFAAFLVVVFFILLQGDLFLIAFEIILYSPDTWYASTGNLKLSFISFIISR